MGYQMYHVYGHMVPLGHHFLNSYHLVGKEMCDHDQNSLTVHHSDPLVHCDMGSLVEENPDETLSVLRIVGTLSIAVYLDVVEMTVGTACGHLNLAFHAEETHHAR